MQNKSYRLLFWKCSASFTFIILKSATCTIYVCVLWKIESHTSWNDMMISNWLWFTISQWQLSSKPGFFRQNSERRSFKLLELRKTGRDGGIASPSRVSPPSTPSSPDDTPCLSGDPYNRRRRKIPKVPSKRGPVSVILDLSVIYGFGPPLTGTLARRLSSTANKNTRQMWQADETPKNNLKNGGKSNFLSKLLCEGLGRAVSDKARAVTVFFFNRWCRKSTASLRPVGGRRGWKGSRSQPSPVQEEVCEGNIIC